MRLEVALYAHLERDAARWTSHTGAVEPDPHQAVRADIQEFDVATIRLDSGPDEIDHPGGTFPQGRLGCGSWMLMHARMVRPRRVLLQTSGARWLDSVPMPYPLRPRDARSDGISAAIVIG